MTTVEVAKVETGSVAVRKNVLVVVVTTTNVVVGFKTVLVRVIVSVSNAVH